MAAVATEIKRCGKALPCAAGSRTMWRNDRIGFRLASVRGVPLALALLALPACRLRDGALVQDGASPAPSDVAVEAAVSGDGNEGTEAGEPPGVTAAPDIAGCSDGSREGFRSFELWPDIAGCAGAFDQPGVLGEMATLRSCSSLAGDTNTNVLGIHCSAADLCAPSWHLCRGGADVAVHSPSGDCESCVPAGEQRFFIAAVAASSMGICSPDPQAGNDLHGCGGLGEPEDATCSPLSRRMGFADCLGTKGVWSCGGQADSTQEARLVRKSGTTLGGVLCCRGD
jgi:hypothetical protein